MNKKKPFVATWMELEIIIPNEVNQKEKDEYHMISLIYICVCVYIYMCACVYIYVCVCV